MLKSDIFQSIFETVFKRRQSFIPNEAKLYFTMCKYLLLLPLFLTIERNFSITTLGSA